MVHFSTVLRLIILLSCDEVSNILSLGQIAKSLRNVELLIAFPIRVKDPRNGVPGGYWPGAIDWGGGAIGRGAIGRGYFPGRLLTGGGGGLFSMGAIFHGGYFPWGLLTLLTGGLFSMGAIDRGAIDRGAIFQGGGLLTGGLLTGGLFSMGAIFQGGGAIDRGILAWWLYSGWRLPRGE